MENKELAIRLMVAAALVIAGDMLLARTALPQDFSDLSLIEACEHRYTGGRYHQRLFRYRLFVPRAMRPGERATRCWSGCTVSGGSVWKT